MICERCQQKGLKSTIKTPHGTRTLLGFSSFYDETGVFHSHDPNRTTHHYRCSKGHEWTTRTREPCPVINCEWNEKSAEMKINEINEILRKILALFDDPHLGISTWHTNVVKLQRELQDKIDEAFHQEVDPGTPEAAGRGVDI